MHGGHHGAAMSPDQDTNLHAHADQSHAKTLVKCGSISNGSDAHKDAGQCCSGICLSVVLIENTMIPDDSATIGRYLMPNAQTRSVVVAGFLRPPQFLI